MKLEYQNGVRIPPLAHEMSPLEVAIQRYENMAQAHFNKTGDVEGSKQALDHLKLERMQLSAQTEVQTSLEQYRSNTMKATSEDDAIADNAINSMLAEGHHPTALLESFMRAEGVPKPSPSHTAHHIVPGKGRTQENYTSRLHLHEHGIGINDPANGVYLVTKDRNTPHWSMPDSRGHRKYHTNQYEAWVQKRITVHNNMDFIKTELQVIGRLLQNNSPEKLKAIIEG